MLDEILAQAHCFFDSPDLYERLGIRYRRGFLFVGPAGCGKSMMIRHILWQVYWRHTPKIMSLQIASNVDDDDLAGSSGGQPHSARRWPCWRMWTGSRRRMSTAPRS